MGKVRPLLAVADERGSRGDDGRGGLGRGRAEVPAGGGPGVPAAFRAGVPPNGLIFLFAKNAFGTGWSFQPVPMDV